MLTVKKKNLKLEYINLHVMALGSSILSNVGCFFYIQQQNSKIVELIKNNNKLVDSISNLNSDIAKLGEKFSLIHLKSTPVIVTTSDTNVFFSKPLLAVCLIAVSASVSYYLSSVVATKISSITIPKLISLSTMIAKLPFMEQTKEMEVFIKDLSTTLLIRTLNDEILDIKFRYIEDTHFTPIIKAIEVFLESENSKAVVVEEVLKNGNAAETIAETITNLSTLF